MSRMLSSEIAPQYNPTRGPASNFMVQIYPYEGLELYRRQSPALRINLLCLITSNYNACVASTALWFLSRRRAATWQEIGPTKLRRIVA
jgi:hypothetical protein